MAAILVIEDEALIARVVRDKLSHEGHQVSSVSSGAAALDSLKTARPDLIILDVLMPDMDGFEVVRRLKDDPATRAIPIMMLTVLSQDDRMTSLGIDAYLTKPYRGSDLLAAIREVLARTSGGSHDR